MSDQKDRSSRFSQQEANELPAHEETPSRVQQLQARLGNSRLAQMRSSSVIQTEGAPDWIKDQLGIDSTQEANHSRVLEARASAEDTASSMTMPSGGTALEDPIRQHAESHLGVGLDDVKVVKGADSVCEPMGAMAFASGNDVYLSSAVDTSTQDGQFTVMHELAHVAQQKRGETTGLEGLGGDEGKRESLEHKADSEASKMLG